MFEMPIMEKKNDRLNRLIEWAKNTYGPEISQRVANESPQKEADFWIALNKVKAAQDQKYQGTLSYEKFS